MLLFFKEFQKGRITEFHTTPLLCREIGPLRIPFRDPSCKSLLSSVLHDNPDSPGHLTSVALSASEKRASFKGYSSDAAVRLLTTEPPVETRYILHFRMHTISRLLPDILIGPKCCTVEVNMFIPAVELGVAEKIGTECVHIRGVQHLFSK